MNTHAGYRYLLPMWEGGGTIPPELGIARRLLAAGHAVHVLGDPTVEADARSAGCAFTAWRRAPHRTSLDPEHDLLRDWEVRNPLAMLQRIRDVFVAGPAADYAADTREVIDRIAPDAVIPDFMLFGTVIAAQSAGLPVAPIVPNIWAIPTPGGPAIGPGFAPARTVLGRSRDRAMLALADRLFRAGLPALNAARAEHGLRPLTSFYDQVLDSDRIFVLTSPTFDFASDRVPDNVRYLGPVIDDPAWARPWLPPWPADHPHPLVLVGFSSTFQDQAPLLRRVVEALSSLPVRGVVTLGQMLDARDVPGTDNVAVVPSAPHGRILPHASLVVSHCGHGTTLKALAAGLPILCLPMGRDQNDTAARVIHHGAGIRLGPTAEVPRIRQALQRLLDDPGYRDAAGVLAAAIERERAETDVVAQFEHLAAMRSARTSRADRQPEGRRP